MTKETFIKEKMEMGFTYFDAIAQWNRKNEQKQEVKETQEVYQDLLDEYHN